MIASLSKVLDWTFIDMHFGIHKWLVKGDQKEGGGHMFFLKFILYL